MEFIDNHMNRVKAEESLWGLEIQNICLNTCPNCSHLNQYKANYCVKCGGLLPNRTRQVVISSHQLADYQNRPAISKDEYYEIKKVADSSILGKLMKRYGFITILIIYISFTLLMLILALSMIKYVGHVSTLYLFFIYSFFYLLGTSIIFYTNLKLEKNPGELEEMHYESGKQHVEFTDMIQQVEFQDMIK